MRLLLLSALLPAFALADAVNLSVTNKVMKGKGAPAVHIEIQEPIAGFELTLSRDGGAPQVWRGGGRPGVKRSIPLPHPDGSARWQGALNINLPDGQVGSMTLDFETEVVAPLALHLDKEQDVDLPGRRLRFSLNQPVDKAHLRVVMDSGAVIVDDDITFNGEPAGTKLEVSWPQAAGNVLRIDLRAHAKSGVFTGVELTPWRFDIAHEEVNFDSGRWNIPAGEVHKVDASVKEVLATLKLVAGYVTPKLYIVGHTDTVGGNEGNRALSLNRAKAIGEQFRRQGVKVPIFYEGLGEEALLVSTTDEADELRNRRAEYILAIEEPSVKKAPFPLRWRRL